MSEKAKDALMLADELMDGMSDECWNQLKADAAALLRTQHADIGRKDALLRRALETLECVHEDGEHDPGHRCTVCDDYVDRNGGLRDAITKELQ